MLTRFGSRRSLRAGIVAAALLVSGGLFGMTLNRKGWADEPVKAQTVAATKAAEPAPMGAKTAALAELENAFTAIADRVEPSVVSITVKKTVRTAGMMPGMDDLFGFRFPGQDGSGAPGGRQGMPSPRVFHAQASGSGVIVRSDGWIITNDHVVDGADKVTVKLQDGRTYEGTVRRDFRSDLALVKINASELVPIEFGNSDNVKVGQWAIAFGSPFELDETMTVGIISARHRQKAISEGREARFYPSLLQTDASINPGNSGGALVDIYGRLVGINVAINSPTGGSVGIGFAIPSNTAREIMDQLITSGKVTRGFLGVAPRALNPTERERYHVESGGALVEQVSEDTPAAKAGLEVEDVIVRFDGKPIADDISLREAVARTAPGKQVDIVVMRGGKERTLTATLEPVSDKQIAGAAQPEQMATGKLGLRVEPVAPETAKKYNLSNTANGVQIADVASGSPAEEAGLQPGMVILRANGRAVNSADDLKAATQNAKSGDTVTLVIAGEKNRTLVNVQIP